MRAKRKFFIIIICILTATVTLIGGCVDSEDYFVFDNKYNATLYDQAIDFDWFNDDYLMENMINNCFNGKFDIWDNVVYYVDDETDEVQTIEGYTFPKEIIKTVETQEELDTAFKDFPYTVNFEKQFLVVYFFRTYHAIYINGVRTYRCFSIKSTELIDKTLSINIYRNDWTGVGNHPDTMKPSRKALIIKMDKIERENITIILS